MMHSFLTDNRNELIARCAAKVALRPQGAVPPPQMYNGIPLFLDQLTRTLQSEAEGDVAEGERISGPSGGDQNSTSEIGASAAAHGNELLARGYSVDQVVHDYGDLCQAITDLAVERNAPFSIDQFRTLNRCLDNAIADAVTEFSTQREANASRRNAAEANERVGILVHELRNSLHTAKLGFAALEVGVVPIHGSTGALVNRSLLRMAALIEQALGEVRADAGASGLNHVFSLAEFIADAKRSASLSATARGCALAVPEVDGSLGIAGNRGDLMAALVNLLHNAFKFTHAHSEVTLHAYRSGDRVCIDVKDNCGGLPPGFVEQMFRPFSQGSADRSGLGLGLSIARRAVEANGGLLSVQDVPGKGCVFTIDLPRHSL